MDYPEWESTVPERVRNEPVWQMIGYRKALYLYELAWQDCGLMLRDPRGVPVTFWRGGEGVIREGCAAVSEMSRLRIGALIAFER